MLAASHPQKKRVSSGKAQPLRARLQPGWPHGHSHWCGTAAPERFPKSFTSLVPDPNPQSCSGRAEGSSESTGAVLEKGLLQGRAGGQEWLWGSQKWGMPAQSRSSICLKKDPTGKLGGSWDPAPGGGRRRTLPLSPWAALQAGQLCQASACNTAGNLFFLHPILPTKLPQAVSQRKSFVPKCEGFYHQSTLLLQNSFL